MDSENLNVSDKEKCKVCGVPKEKLD